MLVSGVCPKRSGWDRDQEARVGGSGPYRIVRVRQWPLDLAVQEMKSTSTGGEEKQNQERGDDARPCQPQGL